MNFDKFTTDHSILSINKTPQVGHKVYIIINRFFNNN